jgi:hypothetical protein
MKSILQLVIISIAAFLVLGFFSCKSLQHSVYYQKSRFPNHLDSIQLNFLNDSLVEIKSHKDKQTFSFYRMGKHYYKINTSNTPSSSPFSYLMTDTLVVKGNKIYYFSDEVKLVFNRKRK